MKKFVFFQKWTKSPDMRSAPLCVTRTRNDIPVGFAVQSDANLLHGEGGESKINVTCCNSYLQIILIYKKKRLF